MLTAQRKSFLSRTYVVRDGQREITSISARWLREGGSFELDGSTYKVGREGWASGSFFVERDGKRVASADKPSAFKRGFNVEYGGESLTFVAKSIWSSTFELRHGTRVIGTIRRTSWWGYRPAIDLPDRLPLEVQIFLTWLVLVMWRRADDSAAAYA